MLILPHSVSTEWDGHLSIWPLVMCPWKLRDKKMSRCPLFLSRRSVQFWQRPSPALRPPLGPWRHSAVPWQADTGEGLGGCQRCSIASAPHHCPKAVRRDHWAVETQWRREGQREKANTHFKASADVSEHYSSTLPTNCTGPSGKCLLPSFAPANCFQFSQSATLSCISNCLHACFFSGSPLLQVYYRCSVSLSDNAYCAICHCIFICLWAL